jgi:hypothetical protein
MPAISCQLSGKTRYAAVVWLSGSVYVFRISAAISDRSRSASDRVRPTAHVCLVALNGWYPVYCGRSCPADHGRNGIPKTRVANWRSSILRGSARPKIYRSVLAACAPTHFGMANSRNHYAVRAAARCCRKIRTKFRTVGDFSRCRWISAIPVESGWPFSS